MSHLYLHPSRYQSFGVEVEIHVATADAQNGMVPNVTRMIVRNETLQAALCKISNQVRRA